MPAKILFLGLATDGPSNVAFLPKNAKELRALYGGGYTERFTLSPYATSVTLSYEPWGYPTNKVEDVSNQLFSPTVSGSVMYFGTIGGSGNQTVDLTYLPYLGSQDLIFAARKYLERSGSLPYVMRCGGTKASKTSGGWTFEAKYEGDKYNNVYLSYLALSASAGTLNITGLEPNFPSLRYTGSITAIKRSIEHDFQIGICPLSVTESSATLSNFSGYLTGGDDGSFTATDLQDILDSSTIPLDATHVVCLAEISSAYVLQINTHLQDYNNQPRMFLFGSPTFTSAGSTWVIAQETALPERSNMVGCVVGVSDVLLDGIRVSRYSVEAAAISFGSRNGYNITNIPVDVLDWNPKLSETDLNYLKEGGFMSLNRYILNDVSVYQGTTIAGRTSFLFNSKVAEIIAVSSKYCFPYLGRLIPQGEHPEIAAALKVVLQTIQFIQITNVTVVIVEDTMQVSVTGDLPGEILSISFSIKNR